MAKTPPRLHSLVCSEVADIRRRAAINKAWMTGYDRLAGIRNEPILEADVGGGCRLLLHCDAGIATLLSFGNHSLPERYASDPRLLRTDLSQREPLPPWLDQGFGVRLFPPPNGDGSDVLEPYHGELEPEWVYFLDRKQADACQALVAGIEAALIGERPPTVWLLLGGPGTGKTTILTQLLLRISAEVRPSRETWDVALDISDRVAQMLEAATRWDLTRPRERVAESASPEVLLFDDPDSIDDICAWGALVRAGDCRAAVFAFDPLQLEDSVTDGNYINLVTEFGAEQVFLSSCYRQKRVVGRFSFGVAEVVAESSPFLREDKQQSHRDDRKGLTQLANTVTFPNPSGSIRTFENAEYRHWSQRIRWIKGQRLWRHWPPLLIVTDPTIALPARWIALADSVRHHTATLAELDAIKGLEYQHVFLVLSERRYRDIERGFTGSGQRLYDDYRRLRIPFSRAKDSLSVFVPNPDAVLR